MKTISDWLLQRSVTGGLGSIQAEIMADTAVALASANVQLVSKKVIWRLCRVSFIHLSNSALFILQSPALKTCLLKFDNNGYYK